MNPLGSPSPEGKPFLFYQDGGEVLIWFRNRSMLLEEFSNNALFEIQPGTLVFINLVPLILKSVKNSVFSFLF